MPTNKLWLEHTERAAWQSVQALREKLADAERRAERMAPPVAGWRELFDALDRAREQHALAGETYADMIRAALERLARAAEERRSLEARRVEEAPAPAYVALVPASPSRNDDSADWEDDDPADSERPSANERRLSAETRRRARELSRKRPRADLHAALSEVEARLADLPGLESNEIFEIAADLGALALCLGSRRTPRDE